MHGWAPLSQLSERRYGRIKLRFKECDVANQRDSVELALGIPVPVGGEYNMDFPAGLVFDVADFLVGGSNTATALTITAYGEITITK